MMINMLIILSTWIKIDILFFKDFTYENEF